MRNLQALKLEITCPLSDCSVNKNRESYTVRKAEETCYSGTDEWEGLKDSNSADDSSLRQNSRIWQLAIWGGAQDKFDPLVSHLKEGVNEEAINWSMNGDTNRL